MKLGMADRDYGWTAEMQIKAARKGLRLREASVSYRKRIGNSKISGTWKGAPLAGVAILSKIFSLALAEIFSKTSPEPPPGPEPRSRRNSQAD